MEKTENGATYSLKKTSLAPKEGREAYDYHEFVCIKAEGIISPLPPSDNTPCTYHYQHKMTQEEVAEMRTLMEVCGFETKKELLNNAIEILNWMAKKLQEGQEITSYHPEDESVRKLRLPFFSNIKSSEKQDN